MYLRVYIYIKMCVQIYILYIEVHKRDKLPFFYKKLYVKITYKIIKMQNLRKENTKSLFWSNTKWELRTFSFSHTPKKKYFTFVFVFANK